MSAPGRKRTLTRRCQARLLNGGRAPQRRSDFGLAKLGNGGGPDAFTGVGRRIHRRW